MSSVWWWAQREPVRGTGLLRFEEAFGEAREEADSDRQCAVVEIIARVVQHAAAFAGAIADPQHRARHLLQHVGKILAAERWRDVAVDLLFAADLRRDIGGEFGLGGMVDRRGVAAAVFALG